MEQRERLEANRALGKRFFAEQDRLRGGPSPDLCAPQYRARFGGNPPMDRSGHEGFARAFYGAFEDLHHDVELAIAEEESVVVRFILHGTHTGAFFGVPPTNKHVSVAANVVLRL